MSDNVETMAYAGATPWHGKGHPVSNDLTPREMQLKAELDWTVEKVPQYVEWNGQFVQVPNTFGLQRSKDGKILTTVKGMYKPVQPETAMEFFSEFVKAGQMSMHAAGSLEGGRRIWALASLNEGFTLKGGDRVDGYLLLCCPYIVGISFVVKFTSIRAICANTVAIALKDRANMAAFRMGHMKAFDDDMQELAKEKLGLARERMGEYREQSELLATTRVPNSQALLQYVAALSGSKVMDAIMEEQEAEQGGDVLDAMIAADAGAQVAKVIREDDLNRVGKTILEAIVDSPGSDMPSARGTWWGAVNGVTYAADHQLGKNADSRLTSAWFGQRATLKQDAMSLAVKYATV